VISVIYKKLSSLRKILILHQFICLIAILPLFWGNCASTGERARQVEERENLKRELEYGRLLAFKIIKKYPLLVDKKATMYVSKVGKSVALFAGRSDFEYHFTILNANQINAYATPGGYIFITSGALKAMDNESELAGVLAHEIAHVNLKHILKDLPPPRDTKGIVDRLAAVLSAQGTVISSAMTQTAEQAADLLFKKGYQINDEYEADRTALTYAAATGYNPRGLIDFLNLINKKKSETGAKKAYNTHPDMSDRIGQLEKFFNEEEMKSDKPKVASRFRTYLGHLK
jgi:predicted Zn-dependent protease